MEWLVVLALAALVAALVFAVWEAATHWNK
jgi:hypothetical protein